MAILFAFLACLNAFVADRQFRNGRPVFGTVAVAAVAFCLWACWSRLQTMGAV